MFKVEIDNEYKGYRYVVLFNSVGHRCGYVGVPKGHRLYGISYSRELPFLKKSDLENKEIGNRGIIPIMISAFSKSENVSLDVYLDVHGGLTYSGDSKEYPVPSDLYWFGFDCGHAGDEQDYDTAYEYGLLDTKSYLSLKEINNRYGSFGEIRSAEYVENECKSMIDQIEELPEWKK